MCHKLLKGKSESLSYFPSIYPLISFFLSALSLFLIAPSWARVHTSASGTCRSRVMQTSQSCFSANVGSLPQAAETLRPGKKDTVHRFISSFAQPVRASWTEGDDLNVYTASPSYTLTHTPSHSHTLTHTHTHINTLTCSLTHSQTHSTQSHTHSH